MLYDRIASLLIGTTSAQAAVRIRGLRVVFDVKKTRTKSPNTAKIEVYNLSDETRNKIKEEDGFVVLRAGYVQSGEEDVFRGNIQQVYKKKQPPDSVTVIEAQDGNSTITEKTAALSYGSGISAKRIMNDVIGQIGIGRKSTSVVSVADKQLANGFSFSGLAKDALSKITEFLGLEWSIQDNEVKLVPVDGADGYPVVLLSSDSGMIDSPVKLDDKKNKLAGWSVRALLMPGIEPASRVALESEEIPSGSIYTVSSISHNGDTWGDAWTSKLELYNKTVTA